MTNKRPNRLFKTMSWKADIPDPGNNGELETYLVNLDPNDYLHTIRRIYSKEALADLTLTDYDFDLICPGIRLRDKMPRPFKRRNTHPIELNNIRFQFNMPKAFKFPIRVPCEICGGDLYYIAYYVKPKNNGDGERKTVAHFHSFYKTLGRKISFIGLELKPKMNQR